MASTWAGTANNETVSKNALNNAILNSIFYQRTTFTPSTEQTTKSEAAAWVFLDESASPFAGKASNQLVVKTDLVAATPIYIGIFGGYNGTFQLDIYVNISSALPQSITLYFEWCTDSGADGYVTFSLPASFSGTTGVTVNLSSFGAFSGTYASGSVVTTSVSTVTALYVKGATIVFSTSDTTRPYLVSYENIDNACSGTPAPVVDECLVC